MPRNNSRARKNIWRRLPPIPREVLWPLLIVVMAVTIIAMNLPTVRSADVHLHGIPMSLDFLDVPSADGLANPPHTYLRLGTNNRANQMVGGNQGNIHVGNQSQIVTGGNMSPATISNSGSVDLSSPWQALPTLGPPTPPTIDEVLARLRSASVAFNTPNIAQVGKQLFIEANLSPQLPADQLRVTITVPGKIEVGTLRVSDRMIATLLGGNAFDVSPNGPQEQLISNNEITGWTWTVTPKLPGEHFLVLTFDAKFIVNGTEGKRTINAFRRKIVVGVEWPKDIIGWLEYIKKAGENASWFWATLLVPIGGWVWTSYKKKRGHRDPRDIT